MGIDFLINPPVLLLCESSTGMQLLVDEKIPWNPI